MDAKIAFVFLVMTTVAVKGFANVEKESVEGEVTAENELVEGDVAKKIKELTHDLEDTRREVKMLNAHNHVDKRGQKLRRIVRSETQSALQEMEQKLEGKEEIIEATGQKKGTAMMRAGDDKFQMLEKKINKVVKTLTEKIDASAKDLAAQIDSSKKTFKTQIDSSKESFKTQIESSAKSLKNTQTEVNNLKSAVANQLRCLSGYTEKTCSCDPVIVGSPISPIPKCTARVTFSPAFAGKPALTFALSEEGGNAWMKSNSVSPTHVDIGLGWACNIRAHILTAHIQWMACGVPKRQMTDNMLVEFLRFYQ